MASVGSSPLALSRPAMIRRRSRKSGGAGWLVPPLVVIAGIVFYPLGYIVYTALTGTSVTYGGTGFLGAFQHVVASHAFTTALLSSIKIASISTAGCLTLGFVLALIVSFVPFPGSRLVSRFVDLGIAFPSFFIALSFAYLYGSTGFVNGALKGLLGSQTPPLGFLSTQWGVILAEVTFYTPFAMRPLLAAFSQVDNALIEVASSLGARPWRVIRQIIFPEVVPALLAGGSLCLVLTLNEFGIVLFMGAKGVLTLPVFIYEMKTSFDFPAAAAAAVVSVVLSLGLYTGYRLLLSRYGGRRAPLD